MYEENAKGGAQHSAMLYIRLYQVLAADTTESALRLLADVFAITEPEGYVRTFVDEGRLLAPLLRLAISRKISAQYAAKLLAIIEAEKQRKLATIKRTNLLSERELEVLKLLAAGLSSRQIAEKLTVSLNTTNTHIRHIFEKLDSKSRVQAIARARELKLIR
jgi:LuxR family maltose regulon positive regulatory protein